MTSSQLAHRLNNFHFLLIYKLKVLFFNQIFGACLFHAMLLWHRQIIAAILQNASFRTIGCYPRCPPEYPIYNEETKLCGTKETCGCYYNDIYYIPGSLIPNYEHRELCHSWYVEELKKSIWTNVVIETIQFQTVGFVRECMMRTAF